MNLAETRQIEAAEIVDSEFHLALFATGYEKRATHLIHQWGNVRAKRKVALGYTDRIDKQRLTNDIEFKAADFEIIEANGNSGLVVRSIIAQMSAELPTDTNIKILVDYSSMTRPWFAAAIEAVRHVQQITCEIYFCYSPSRFETPADPSSNTSVGPVSNFSSLGSPEKPTALILGLGYERERALGLKEYIDPAVTLAFYTEPALEKAFTDSVLTNNSGLLQHIPPERVIKHPLTDLQHTSNLLSSVYFSLRDEYRLIVAPMGVKPFSLLCLLLAYHHKDLDVWRVSPGVKGTPLSRPPIGPIIVLYTLFLR